jgi:hypothetical protein
MTTDGQTIEGPPQEGGQDQPKEATPMSTENPFAPPPPAPEAAPAPEVPAGPPPVRGETGELVLLSHDDAPDQIGIVAGETTHVDDAGAETHYVHVLWLGTTDSAAQLPAGSYKVL